MTAVLARAAFDPHAVLAKARTFGRLRSVSPEQAPFVREAVQYDLDLAPRWQRGGQGIRDLANPAEYAEGSQWIPSPTLVRADDGRRYYARRVTSGVAHRTWRNRAWWLKVLLPAALDNRPEARGGKISRSEVLRIAEHTTALAHASTGRSCIVRVDKLAEIMQCSEQHIRNFWRTLQELGVAVLMRPGRMLDQNQKTQAYQGGSTQRGFANEWAFVLPTRAPAQLLKVRYNPVRPPLTLIPGGAPVDTLTPARGNPRKPQNLTVVSSLGHRKPEEPSGGKAEPPPAARHRRESGHPRRQSASQSPRNEHRSPSGRVYNPQALNLARDLTETQALPWLKDAQPGRLEPALRRFTTCNRPWTPQDVATAIDQANTRLGRASMTRTLVKSPPALLAKYLRDFDPDADHPRAWMDLEQFTTEPVSPTITRNRQLLAAKRAGQNMATVITPEGTAAAIAATRAAIQRT